MYISYLTSKPATFVIIMSAAELSPLRHRLDNANVSYLFQDWQSFISCSWGLWLCTVWYVSLYVAVLAGTFIYSVWCEVFLKSFVFCHFFFLFNSIATQARCDARYADLYISFFSFHSFSFFFCICFFGARFSSYPGPEICVRSSSELELRVSSCFSCYYIVFSCRLSSLALVVFVLVYLYFFFVEAGRILISGYHICRLRCVLVHVHSLCSSHDWGRCLLFAFAGCFRTLHQPGEVAATIRVGVV